jgi:hypothetical protein
MLFGRSVFQSVVERLQHESLAEEEPIVAPNAAKPRVTTSFIFDTAREDAEDGTAFDPAKAYRGLDLDLASDLDDDPLPDSSAIELPKPAPTRDVIAPAPVVDTKNDRAPAPNQQKDLSFLNRVSLADVQKELALNSTMSVEALQTKRRHFARTNHPDMVPEDFRANSTLRMTAANLLIDKAIKDRELRSRFGG